MSPSFPRCYLQCSRLWSYIMNEPIKRPILTKLNHHPQAKNRTSSVQHLVWHKRHKAYSYISKGRFVRCMTS